MDISFDGAYDRAAFEKGLALLERRSFAMQIVMWLMALLLVVSLGLAISLWMQDPAGTNLLRTLSRPGLLAFFLAYFYVWPRLARRARVDKLFKDRSTRRMTGKADPEGIHIQPATGSSVTFKWEQFMRKGSGDSMLALLMVDGTIALFQESFFQSAAEWSRFLQLVEQRVIQPK